MLMTILDKYLSILTFQRYLNLKSGFQYLLCKSRCATFCVWPVFSVFITNREHFFKIPFKGLSACFFLSIYLVVFFSSSIKVYLSYLAFNKCVGFIYLIITNTICYLIFLQLTWYSKEVFYDKKKKEQIFEKWIIQNVKHVNKS